MRSFESFDGTRIAFGDWGPTGGGVPVLLHHGFAVDTSINWEAPGVVESLVGAGRRVIGIDARGHGRSEKPHDPRAYDAPAMALDVAMLLDHLALEAVDLVGYSMGALVGLDVVGRERRIRSVVLGGVGAAAGSGPLLDRERIAEALVAPEPPRDDPVAARIARLAELSGADRQALAAVLQARPHAAVDPASIEVPVLVLAGEDDPLAAGAEDLAASIPSARHERVPGDHLGAVGAPELVRAVLEFLGELDRA